MKIRIGLAGILALLFGAGPSPYGQPLGRTVVADSAGNLLQNDTTPAATTAGSHSRMGTPANSHTGTNPPSAAATSQSDTNPPGVPVDVLAFDLPEDDGTHVRVTWKAASDPEGGPVVYRVALRPADSSEEYKAATEEMVSETSLDIAGLTKQRRYEFVVAARDRFGNSSANSAPAAATPTDEVPQAPGSAPNALGGANGTTVTWVAAPEADAAGYKLERAEVQLGASDCGSRLIVFEPTYVEVAQLRGKGNTEYLDEQADSGRRYCYRYRIFDNSNPPNDSGYSPAVLATAPSSG